MKKFIVKKSHTNSTLNKFINNFQDTYEGSEYLSIDMSEKEFLEYIDKAGFDNTTVNNQEWRIEYMRSPTYEIVGSNTTFHVQFRNNTIIKFAVRKRIGSYGSRDLLLDLDFMKQCLFINDEIGRMKSAVRIRKEKKSNLLHIQKENLFKEIFHKIVPNGEIHIRHCDSYSIDMSLHNVDISFSTDQKDDAIECVKTLALLLKMGLDRLNTTSIDIEVDNEI